MPRAFRFLVLAIGALVVLGGCSGRFEPGVWPQIAVRDAPDDPGGAVQIAFRLPESATVSEVVIERGDAPGGPFQTVATLPPPDGPVDVTDASATLDSAAPERGRQYYYRVSAAPLGVSSVVGPVTADAEWWDNQKLAVFLAVVAFSLLVWYFIRLSKRNPDIYVRPISGLSAITDAIGRATEMGKPVLYVPGIMGMDDIQTITAIVILKEVAKRTAEYQTQVIVPCCSPVVMTAAEEAVRTGCIEAGNPDLYRRDSVRFLSDEQFAFTAATNGIMLRERPAANIYLGSFYAESLILAETGFLAGAIQIAGTANSSQLPFFVAACDFTLIGEEIYAASAYLSKEPMLLGSLKGSDWAKVLFAAAILVGAVLASYSGEPKGAIWRPFIEFFK